MWHVQGYPRSHWTPPLGNHLLRIAPAAARATANDRTTTKQTNFDCYFDGRGGAPVQYRVNHPIKEVQGFGRRHWTLPLGKYFGQ